jgi:hypothetical protein
VTLCFEVKVNEERPVLAGLADAKVVTAILSYVTADQDLTLAVGAMGSDSVHVDWVQRELKPGDVLTVRIVESDAPTQPVSRRREDPAALADQERAYYESLRRKFEAKDT